MMRKFKVMILKRKARKLYLRWRDENNDLDCGSHIAAMLRPSSYRVAQQLDDCIDKLRALGEQCPDTRFYKGGDL